MNLKYYLLTNCKRKYYIRRFNVTSWSSDVKLTAQSNFDEAWLRIDSKALTFKPKFKTNADVVVFWMKITCRMKHCMLFRRSAPHKSKPELNQCFHLKCLMKWISWFWDEESENYFNMKTWRYFTFLCRNEDADILIQKGRKVEQQSKPKWLCLKRHEVSPH